MNPGYGTKQIHEWTGHFGRGYSDRNTLEPSGLDALWMTNYGITRTALIRDFLGEIPKSARILEVGCNVGNQLLLLHVMGYSNLCGIDIQSYAIELARTRLPDAAILQGSSLDIPFSAGAFDLVFTSGLLIHIAPVDLPTALNEIHRVAKTWILGSEYYAPSSTEIKYRGHQDLLWKDDFARLYQHQFEDLRLLREQRLPYVNASNVDTMFLLQRTSEEPR